MPKRNQPPDLLTLSVDKSLELIVKGCYYITNKYPITNLQERYRQADILRMFLINTLPLSLLEILCKKRKETPYCWDPQVWLHIFIHPKMKVFHTCYLDYYTLENYWIQTLALLTKLVVLRLHCTCTDEILKTIGTNCFMLEELDITSKAHNNKKSLNTCSMSVGRNKVSDAGLFYITNLKQLKILSTNVLKRENISDEGIVMLLTQLPQLEWFILPSARLDCINIAITLSNLKKEIGPLRLKMLECPDIPPDDLQRVFKSCPNLQELYMLYWPKPKQENVDVLDKITASDVKLNKLCLMHFRYSLSLQHLLQSQGQYLTQLFLCDIYESIDTNALEQIGLSCPHLVYLGLHTNTRNLIPKLCRGIFKKLKTLILGVRNYDIENVLLFFLNCSQNIRRLVISYNVPINVSQSFEDALQKGYLKNVERIWLNHNIILSFDVIQNIIENCDNLSVFKVTSDRDLKNIDKYISDNNLDLRFNKWELITNKFEKYCLIGMFRSVYGIP